MTTSGTPQYLAVQFMADEDPAELDIPESTGYDDAMDFVQRYVVTLLYYSTNGPEWDNQLNFLTDLHVCNWNEQIGDSPEASVGNYDGWMSGVQCQYSDDEVDYVFIRTCFYSPPRCGNAVTCPFSFASLLFLICNSQ